MVISAPPTHPLLLGEKRVTLHHLTWQSYQQILQALPHSRAAKLTYDRGVLEITMPLEEHESFSELLGLFVRILVVEMGYKLKSLRSTTLNRQDLQRGAEPDNAYYIQNQPQVAGRKIDLHSDPPPDLVIEVDIAHTDIDKNNLYAALGVPELWRFNGQEWRIWQLVEGVYQECDRSPTFPWVKKEYLYNFLAEAQQDEVLAEQNWRRFIRDHLGQESL